VAVNVLPSYTIVAQAVPPFICSGSTATLSAYYGSPAGYTWATSTGTFSGALVQITPSVTTSYTVTTPQSCGTSSAVVTVTVTSSTFTANLTGNTFICSGSSSVLTASASAAGTFTYNWSPAAPNTQTISIAPADNVTYSCTLTNGCGTASVTACVDITSSLCCTACGESIPYNSYVNSGSPYANLSNGSLCISGTAFINTNVTWTNMTVRMSSAARIIIIGGNTLTLNGCKLFSCQDMWEGIILQIGSGSPAAQPKIVATNTSIEDAYRAIFYDVQNNPYNDNVSCRNTIFNKNYIGICLSNSPSRIGSVYINDQCSFTSSITATSPGTSLKCNGWYTPIIRPRGFAGVYFSAFTNSITIGGTSSAVNTLYENLDYGYYGINSMVRMFYSTFNNMSGNSSGSVPVGVGVCAINPTNQTTSLANVFNCTFKNVWNGVYISDINNYEIMNSTFSITPTGLLACAGNCVGEAAVQAINPVIAYTHNNSIYNFSTGVSHNYSVPSATTYSLGVAQNTITANSGGYCGQAVSVQSSINTYTNANTTLKISANVMSAVSNGIYANNIKCGLRISANTVGLQYASTGAYAGIKFTGTENAMVDNNTVSSTNTANTGLRGMYYQLSPGCFTQCNTVSNVGQGFVFEGNCLSNYTGFVNNTINTANDGLYIVTNGVYGQQGGSLRHASGNQWLGTFTNSKTLIRDASAIYSPMYVRNNANELPAPQTLNKTAGSISQQFIDNYGPAPGNSPASLFVYNFPPIGCPAPYTGWMRTAQADTTGQAYIKLLNDSSLYRLLQGPGPDAVIPDETKELNNAYVYNLMDNGYTTAHAGLNAFYAARQDSTIGTYGDVDSLITARNFYAAHTQNTAAVATTVIQQNQQFINTILLKYLQKTDTVFTQTEMDDLTALAVKCPLSNGTSVYQARSLVCALKKQNIPFTDDCDFTNKENRKANTHTGMSANDSYVLFPNPNNGAMTLTYKAANDATLSIYDVSGRVLYKHTLSKEQSALQLQAKLAEGIYIYSIMDDAGAVLKTGKLVIIQ